MITRHKQKIDSPYSLHDMIVSSIELENGNVRLEFEHGFVIAKDPFPQVDGNITIENVDEDFSCVMLLSELGQYGEFKGEKISVKAFISKYKNCYFEIVDEMYGYNQVEYIGYLSVPQKENQIQAAVSLYFTGDIVYEVIESSEMLIESQ